MLEEEVLGEGVVWVFVSFEYFRVLGFEYLISAVIFFVFLRKGFCFEFIDDVKVLRCLVF